MFHSVGEYAMAKEYYEKALAISTEIGDKPREAELCLLLTSVFVHLNDYRQSKLYCDKALAIIMESGKKNTEAEY